MLSWFLIGLLGSSTFYCAFCIIFNNKIEWPSYLNTFFILGLALLGPLALLASFIAWIGWGSQWLIENVTLRKFLNTPINTLWEKKKTNE